VIAVLTKQQLAYYRELRRDAADAFRFPVFARPASLDYETARTSWFIGRTDFYRRMRLE
jgi:hypothetical protein